MSAPSRCIYASGKGWYYFHYVCRAAIQVLQRAVHDFISRKEVLQQEGLASESHPYNTFTIFHAIDRRDNMFAAHFILLSSLLLGLAMAADWNYAAGFSSWSTNHHTSEKGSMEKSYTSCHEYDANMRATATEAACIHHCVALILQSFSIAFAGGYLNEIMASGVEQSRDLHKALLDHFNVHSKPDGLRATGVLNSHIHPDDGVAIQMNVQGDGSAMHLHTNGSHAMVLFDEADNLQSRNSPATDDGHYFSFSGVNNFKAQAHGINHPSLEAWGDDIDDFAKHWTQSDRQTRPLLQQADAWTFEACNAKRSASFFYGMLAVESGKPEGRYEPVGPMGCQ